MRAIALSLLMIIALPTGRHAMAADSAASLIEAVSRAASNAGTWEAEGRLVIQESADEGSLQTEASFRVVIERVPSRRARIEITGVPAPLIQLCDGSVWAGYRPAAKQFWIVDDARIGPCEDPFNEWSGLAEDLHDAAITGREELHVGDTSIDCAVVRGDYGGSGRSGLRTLWIDDVTKTIWQYRIEGGANRAAPAEPAVRIYTLLSQTSKGVVQPTDFAFQTSIDWTRLTKAPLMRLGDGAPLRPVGAPVVLFKVEPKYTKAAARARIAGRVVLAAEVWPDGAAHNFKVVRSLDPGLDQEAIKAVSKWKFRPGMKDGTLVKVAVTVEVNFRLGK